MSETTKVRMLIEIECNVGHAKDEKKWFMDNVLLSKYPLGGLILHSNEIGDTLGPVKVLEVHPF